jgi:hypothetical protein
MVMMTLLELLAAHRLYLTCSQPDTGIGWESWMPQDPFEDRVYLVVLTGTASWLDLGT